MLAAVAAACSPRSSGRLAQDDPFAAVGVASLPLGFLEGQRALLLAVGGLVVGDSTSPLPDLVARRSELIEGANSRLDSVLRQSAPGVRWVGLEEQRRAVRRAASLGVDPDRLPTAYLVSQRVSEVPEPLWTSVRTLSALSGTRLAVAPAAAKIEGSPGAFTASYIFVFVDTRTGRVLWRGRAVGAVSPSPEAALGSAALLAVTGTPARP